MKKLVHVKSLITLALCLMMCFTFFAPASTVQAKKRVVDNVFMYPTDPYSYPTCTGWVPCKKTFTSSKKASKTYVRETAWEVIDTAYLYKAATSRGKVFYTKSSTRPVGSMNVQRVYWWKHNCKFGQYAPIKVFKTLDIKSEKEYPFFSVTENPLPNLIPDIYIL